jgi:NADH-quinone oxidoreductase subunit K
LFIFSFVVFLIGFSGFMLTRLNVLLWLLSIELMIFAANMNFSWISIFYDDLFGQIYVLLLLVLVAAESAFASLSLVSIYNSISFVDLYVVSELKF